MLEILGERGRIALLKRLISDGFPNIEVVHTAPAFMSNQVLVFRAEATIAIPTRLDEFYEFVLGGPDGFPVLVESSEPVLLKNGCLLPINPGQLHMAAEILAVREYLPMFVNKNFLSELAYQAWGKEHISFANQNHPVSEGTRWLAHEFIEQAADSSDGHSLKLSCLNYELAYSLMRSVATSVSGRLVSMEAKTVHKVEAYLRDSYPDQVSLTELADLVNYSPYHLIRLFKQTTGRTPMVYLLHIRIEQAMNLLRESTLTISEICELCGFGSLSHFSSTFKRVIGYSPSAYRKLL